MKLADGVLGYAEQIQRSYERAVLALRVESEREREEVAERTRAAILRLGGGGEISWSVDVEPAGVIVRQWGYPPDIGATLAALSQSLGCGGIEGRLVVHTSDRRAPRSSILDRKEDLLECHVRTRGERRLHSPEHEIDRAARLGQEPPVPVVRFFPDDAALLAGLTAALAWVARPPPGAELWSVGDLPHRDIGEVSAHIAARLTAAGSERWRATSMAWWESDDRFRLMVVEPGSGDISFVEGGSSLAAGDWEPAYAALLDALRASSAWGSYGLIKRGRQPAQAGRSLTYDWVPALHYGSYNLSHHPYEDVLAPDAFGAQLLGSGYAGRIPARPDWERVDAGGDATLLLHRDPAAWFGEPLPPITPDDCIRRDPSYPTPTVILRAREDLADILITVDVMRRAPVDPLRD